MSSLIRQMPKGTNKCSQFFMYAMQFPFFYFIFKITLKENGWNENVLECLMFLPQLPKIQLLTGFYQSVHVGERRMT